MGLSLAGMDLIRPLSAVRRRMSFGVSHDLFGFGKSWSLQKADNSFTIQMLLLGYSSSYENRGSCAILQG